jgi:hypothetical protein
MAKFDISGHTIVTNESPLKTANKTLIITCHGIQAGTEFDRPFPTVVQFLTPKNMAFAGFMTKVLSGDITPSDQVGVQKKIDDYNLSYFDYDSVANVEGWLGTSKSKKFDIMVLSADDTLSNILATLKTKNWQYPSIWCKFCRVNADQYKDGNYAHGVYYGKKNPSATLMNQHKVNATALALELKQKGFK